MFRNVKSLFIALVAITLMFGCQGPPRPGGPGRLSSVSEDAKTVYVSSRATYSNSVASNIKTECAIDSQVIQQLRIYASKHNIKIVIDGQPKPTDSVLKLSITEADTLSGLSKYVVISGELFKGNKLESSFKAARQSNGAARLGFRRQAFAGACNVLGNCVRTLGRDTASWIVDPVNNAKLGDIHLIK